MKKLTTLIILVIAMKLHVDAQVLQKINGPGVQTKIEKVDSVLLVPVFAAHPPIKRLLPTLDSVGAIYYNPTDSTYYGMANSQWRAISSTGPGVNIYNTNGTLTSNRTVTGAGKSLDWTGLSAFNINGIDARINTITAGLGGGGITTNTVFALSGLPVNTTGFNNTAVGYKALSLSVVGNNNTALGKSALENNTATGNTAIGAGALAFNTIGQGNIGIGVNTIVNNISGNTNIGLGNSILFMNTTGSDNIGIGDSALRNTTTSSNVAIGSRVLAVNSTGYQNVGVGTVALRNNLGGHNNTGIGDSALFNNNSGNYNTAVGDNAGLNVTSGSNNTFVGKGAGAGITTGSGNVIVGTNSTSLSSSLTNNYQAYDGAGNLAFSKDANGLSRINVQALQTVNVSNAGTLTLNNNYSDYVFYGTTTTWTLPPVTGYVNVKYFIKNRGSGAITLNSNAGGNDVYTTSAVSTMTIAPGAAYILVNDGTYWLVE